MESYRSRTGPLVAAVGGMLTAIAMFIPWFSVTVTAAGANLISGTMDRFFSQAPALAGLSQNVHDRVQAAAGHELFSVSAAHAFTRIHVLLLILSGLAVVVALVPLTHGRALFPDGDGGGLVAIGLLSLALVVYRMVAPPLGIIPQGYLDTSLREGAWLALLGSAAIVAGGLWPRAVGRRARRRPDGDAVWRELSGWTPGA